MQGGFHAKKLNTCKELELELAANWTEPENQAVPVPGPDPDKIKSVKFFFKKPNPPQCSINTHKDSLLRQSMSGVSHFLHSSRDTLYVNATFRSINHTNNMSRRAKSRKEC